MDEKLAAVGERNKEKWLGNPGRFYKKKKKLGRGYDDEGKRSVKN